jgi:hypothetical protein
LREIRRRFEDLDAQTGEVMSVLRHADSQRAFIRSNRDWLYRSLRAWEPILREWDATNDLRGLFTRTYRWGGRPRRLHEPIPGSLTPTDRGTARDEH